ncbi:MAG TPA: T9SS type A sorting domain-containing protein, partial [Chitinophagales bacterium]|nr:T9SS type A sorting domain-containing protein [Chitinophagales bacterium]
VTNYDNFETLESETVTLSYPSSFPGIKPLALNMSTVCSPNDGKLVLTSSNSDSFIYPNPSNGFIYMNEIQGYNLDDKVLITDIAGKSVATCNVEQLQHGFSIANFAPGMYFVTVVNENTSATKSCSIVKE